MSLMVCRQEPVKNPYYIEALGVRIWSSAELSYVICHNPLFVMDGFVDEHLTAFIREELDMEALAARLDKWMGKKGDSDQMLFLILSECGYCSSSEQTQFRHEVASLRKLPGAEYARQKGNDLFFRKQYGKAAAIYEKILELPKGGAVTDELLEKVWTSLGCAQARMFQFSKAWTSFSKAYECCKSEDVLKRMYYLSRTGEGITGKNYRLPPVNEMQKEKWEKEIEEAGERAKSSEGILKLEGLFEQEPDKRMAGAAKLVKKWKQEYRSMV